MMRRELVVVRDRYNLEVPLWLEGPTTPLTSSVVELGYAGLPMDCFSILHLGINNNLQQNRTISSFANVLLDLIVNFEDY